MRIFVYGTLKKGDPNHALLDGSHFVCTTRTTDNYIMVDLGAFPGVLKPEDISQMPLSTIMGEVYEINEKTLEDLDYYEGEWYYREEVRLECGFSALMYFLKKIPPMNYKVITDGNWTK
ncbi:Uncharacterized conserved protein YtfP, gamma-glutamylcyclotransferase (GGCT)/AIG2-like family [Methanolobus vulcani]|uniref:Uncharacterized conserved protein YtfP, gamma-glutamylcyclotransferase (GGCT)/AIG2-like family n=1 Tax=Methanolobus vulcani TaxID=38026 RepID=A0A7Z7FCZ2_9EURY|nr:gamma-glutamylcyclotransferase family protein [Methanolobus vulcani]SDF95652.1 Uncharacterized conserved protein YtfP, gamma-glutamylcyclotransferase (GGCT)/AIG2-like family [Methanolobus vulcani]